MSDTKRTYKVWEPLLLSLMTVVGMMAGAKFAGVSHYKEDRKVTVEKSYHNGRQVEEIIRFIETRYVGEVSSDKIVNDAIEAILKDLDPHTHYIPPEEVEALHERTSGSYVGVGIEVAFIDDSLMVLFPRHDSPAEIAGLRPGDYILEVDGRDITVDSVNRKDILNLIKGEKGTTVTLTVKPLMSRDTHQVEVLRDMIKVPSVVAAYMVDSTTAFIKIQRFTGSTYREFMDQWERLSTEENAENLILDLRDNPGGYLEEAVNILSQIFEEEGKLLLYTEGANQSRNEYKSTGKVFFPIQDVVVLINEGSASASEIIAGCLQDHDRGIIVGSPTYGKGLVQEQYSLSNGGILRMTVSKYYTPSGRSIQKPYDTTYVVDTNAVFKTTHGRSVFPGGGITPDIPLSDSINWVDPQGQEWMDLISLYAIRYNLTTHGGELAPMSEYDVVKKGIPPDSLIYRELETLTNRKSEADRKSLNTYLLSHREELLRITRATLIAYRIGEEGWYRGFNEWDPMTIKAKEVMGMRIEEAINL